MLGIIQILFSLFMTIFYVNDLALTFSLMTVVKVVLLFLIFNILYMTLIFTIFIIFIFTTEKIDHRTMWKHRFANLINKYIFSFLFRVIVIKSGEENLPKHNRFVVFSNHIEYTDPLYIMQVIKDAPIAFVAKESLFKVPILKNLLLGMGCVPISRVADRTAMNAIVKSIKKVKEGQPMGIFPEGTRTYRNELIEYKPGAFKLAIKAKADIVPVCLYDMHKISKRFRILPVKVYLRILPIIKYEDYHDMETAAIAKAVYDMTNAALQEFKQKR